MASRTQESRTSNTSTSSYKGTIGEDGGSLVLVSSDESDKEGGLFGKVKKGVISSLYPAPRTSTTNVEKGWEDDEQLSQSPESISSNKYKRSDGAVSTYHDYGDDYDDMRALRIRLEELEESQRAQRSEIENLKSSHRLEIEAQRQQIRNLESAQEEFMALLPLKVPHGGDDDSNASPQLGSLDLPPRQSMMMRGRLSSIVLRNYRIIAGEGVNHEDTLDNDTFTMMILSKVCSLSWALGLAAFIFQITLGIMIAIDQIQLSKGSSIFNVPFTVDTVVRVGQFLTIILCLATQSDILTSIQSIILLGKGSRWDETIGEGGSKSAHLWIIRILIPNLLKFSQGLLVMFVSFVIIVQSEDIIDLLKDFTALMVLSETDNILFDLASYGYLGRTLKEQAAKVTNAPVISDQSNVSSIVSKDMFASSPPRPRRCENGAYFFRPFALMFLFAPILGGWIIIVRNQMNGTFFEKRYPGCTSPNNDTFTLAKEHFNNGKCFGGPLNTLECEFEGGDCINFNLAFPLCKGDDMINVQDRVGNEICEEDFMNAKCDYDGGDCCPYDVINALSFGDGQCNGGVQSAEVCGYDNGDCNPFRLSHVNCPLDQLSTIKGANGVVLGDGVCDSGIYNNEDCGFEYGDCNQGQFGQTLLNTGMINSNDDYVSFAKTMSVDGTTIAVGFSRSTQDENFDVRAPGLVQVWRYDDMKMIWERIGENIKGVSEDDNIEGCKLSMSSSGDRIAIASRSGMRIFQYNDTAVDGEWTQVGETLVSDTSQAYGTIAANGLRVALVHSLNEIRIYNLTAGQTWVYEYHINLDMNLGKNIQINFDPTDDSILLFDVPHDDRNKSIKVYQLNNSSDPISWTQVGQDIESQNVHLISSAIGARGKRVAIPFNTTAIDAPGQVIVYEYDSIQNKWLPLGSSLKGISSQNGNGFGFSINMSSDGNTLVIGSNSPKCLLSNVLRNFTISSFAINECKNGFIEVFNYNQNIKKFQKVIPKPSIISGVSGNSLNLANLVSRNNIFGLHSSISKDGRVLSTSGYDMDDENVFVRAYNLDDFFYTHCAVDKQDEINNGECEDFPPYNSEACGFDGGDCSPKSVNAEDFPNCFVQNTDWFNDRECNDFSPYNTKECGLDGGDCVPIPVDGYQDCIILPEYHDKIGNGFCENNPFFNVEECAFDGDDCRIISVTLPPTTSDETTHGICVTNAPFASASSTQPKLEYTNIYPFVDGTQGWGDRNQADPQFFYVIEGIENSPCRDGIYLQPSIHRDIPPGTTITVTAPVTSTICIFVDSHNLEYGENGGFPETLPLHGFTSYGEQDGFQRGSYGGKHEAVTTFCRHGDPKAVPAPFAMVDFSDPAAMLENSISLYGGAQVLENAPDGVPRALRTGTPGNIEYAKWNVNINPSIMPSCTLVIGLYVMSLGSGYGHVLGHDDGSWDRSIFMNEDNFNGMGMWAGNDGAIKEVNYSQRTSPGLGKWVHLVGVFNQGGDHTFYYNNERAPITFSSSSGEGKEYLMIGGHEKFENRQSDTWIKEVRVYDQALDDGQVAALYSDFQAYLEEVKIPERARYDLVYALDIPMKPGYSVGRPAYFVDRQSDLISTSFNRVAYYLQLDDDYVWVSMDVFTPDIRKIGVPCLSLKCGDGISPTVIQTMVSNVNVISNVPELSGTGLSGNIEFWPYNYIFENSFNVPGASDDVMDFGDTPGTTGDHGSMQVHIHGDGDGGKGNYTHIGTLFAFNNFNRKAFADLGIGNRLCSGDRPDWSQAANANTYSVRNLKVYILSTENE